MGLVFGIVFCFLAPNGLAESDKKAPTFSLSTIVITPSRMDTTSLHVPGSISVITGEDIAASNAQTVIDILRTQSGLVIRDELGNVNCATVDMRGFGEASKMNVLVLIDGRRVNEIDMSGADWTQISLNQVEQIEVSRGAASVLYGDNAVGGVINIRTKKGEGKPKISLTSSCGSYDKRGCKSEVRGSFKNL